MPKKLSLIALTLFALFVFSPQLACPEFFSQEYGAINQVDIVIGETKVIDVSNPKRIAIGDPKVADVAGASNTELILSAKAMGETNLQVWDDFGQREITVRVFAEDLAKLKKRLEDLLSTAGIRGITFQVGDQERKVFVLGDLPLRKKELVTQLLENFKANVINLVTYSEDNPLVEIDVQILEISKVAVDKLGFNWSQTLSFTEQPTPSTHTLNRHLGDSLKSVWQSQFDRNALTVVLNALQQDNLARTLARPKLVALSGKEAKILVGGQIPVLASVSVASGTTTTSIEYVDYGIKMSIKPEVKENGDIVCRLETEIKTIDSSNAITVPSGGGTITSNAFKTRNASTELYLKNNQTIFMAGLIDNQETNNLQNVPGLGNLPILGALFRSKDFRLGDTELVISMTPRIVNYGDMRQDIEGADASKANSDEEPADVYVRMVQEMILKNVSYPLEAQRANLSGEVVLSLHLLSNGQLVGVVVNQSSGHKLLDSAAIFTVKRLMPYPQFPKGLFLKEIWVEVPITYQLS
ncbi:MAG: TonB family protein [Candidatus Omnitrophica bacterium]|nr:TonB family protein [Candidatus Omnitrophota bacterium]